MNLRALLMKKFLIPICLLCIAVSGCGSRSAHDGNAYISPEIVTARLIARERVLHSLSQGVEDAIRHNEANSLERFRIIACSIIIDNAYEIKKCSDFNGLVRECDNGYWGNVKPAEARIETWRKIIALLALPALPQYREEDDDYKMYLYYLDAYKTHGTAVWAGAKGPMP